MDFTLEDWEQLRLDQGDLFWDTALDNYQHLFLLNSPAPSLTSHRDGGDELEAQLRGGLEATGPGVAKAKPSPPPQDLLDKGLSLEVVETLSKDGLTNPHLAEAGMGESWLDGFPDDREGALKADGTGEEGAPERRSHRSQQGLSPESLLFIGEDVTLQGLPVKGPALAEAQECRKDTGHCSDQARQEATQGGEKPCKGSECGKTFGPSHHLLQHWVPHSQAGSTLPQAPEDGLGQSSWLLWPVTPAGYETFVHSRCGQEPHEDTHLRQQKSHPGEDTPKSGGSGHAAGHSTQPAECARAHAGGKSCKCDACGDSFGRAFRLTQRKKTHARQRYECAKCKATFRFKKYLHLHQKVHAPRATCRRQEPRESSGQSSPCLGDQSVRAEEKPYKCDECGKAFSHTSALKIHQRVHSGEKPYKCGECGKAFSRSTHLTEHQRIHTGDRPHKCNSCAKSFSRPSHLVRHQAIHAMEKPYSCPECTETFSHNEHLVQHQKIHSVETPYKCQECGERFICRSTLTCHQSTHTAEKQGTGESGSLSSRKPRQRAHPRAGEKGYKCKVCAKVFSRQKYLTQHEKIHTRVKPFQCPQCGKAFGQSAQLLRHQRGHSGVSPHECGDGGKACAHSASLPEHQAVHASLQPFTCSECGQAFGQNALLSEHQLVHSPEKAFRCSKCGKACAHSRYLVQHQKAHAGKGPSECKERRKTLPRDACRTQRQRSRTGAKPHMCEACGKTFGHGNQLVRHQRVHSRAKPYICQECGKAFSQSSCLSVHMRIHRGEKPFLCTECGKAFTQKANLTQHERMHKGEKPYVCDVCGRAFGSSAHRVQHRRIHTQEKPYQCPYCQKAFRGCSGLSRHQRVHTRKQAE